MCYGYGAHAHVRGFLLLPGIPSTDRCVHTGILSKDEIFESVHVKARCARLGVPLPDVSGHDAAGAVNERMPRIDYHVRGMQVCSYGDPVEG